jgi:WD40-like Beta Propeller Repeat
MRWQLARCLSVARVLVPEVGELYRLAACCLGQQIAFVSDQNGTPRVWTISANGGAPQPLKETNAANTNSELAWWPSREIVYQKPGIRNYLRINGGAQTAILPQESVGWVPLKPIFSPDSKKLAVYWNRKAGVGIWIISLEPYSETLVLAGDVFAIWLVA